MRPGLLREARRWESMLLGLPSGRHGFSFDGSVIRVLNRLVIPEEIFRRLLEEHGLSVERNGALESLRVGERFDSENVSICYMGVNQGRRYREFLVMRQETLGGRDIARNTCAVSVSAHKEYEIMCRSGEVSGILNFHTHPCSSSKSIIDERTFAELRKHFFVFNPAVSLIFMIAGTDGVWGEVHRKNREPDALDEIMVIRAGGISFYYPRNSRIKAGARVGAINAVMHDRTVKAYGGEFLAALSKLRVGIAGAGGTGSCVWDILKHYCRRMTICDGDRVESTNAGRLKGFRKGDTGAFKVDIARREIKAFDPSILVTAVRQFFPESEAFQALKDCEIIFACGDNPHLNYELQKFASLYHKLLFVVNSEVKIDADRSIRKIFAQVRNYIPSGGRKCICCNGFARNVLRQEVEERLKRIGYADEADAETPSVLTVNNAAATLGVRLLISYLGNIERDALPDHLIYDETDLRIDKVGSLFAKNPSCPFCAEGEDSIRGAGDRAYEEEKRLFASLTSPSYTKLHKYCP